MDTLAVILESIQRGVSGVDLAMLVGALIAFVRSRAKEKTATAKLTEASALEKDAEAKLKDAEAQVAILEARRDTTATHAIVKAGEAVEERLRRAEEDWRHERQQHANNMRAEREQHAADIQSMRGELNAARAEASKAYRLAEELQTELKTTRRHLRAVENVNERQARQMQVLKAKLVTAQSQNRALASEMTDVRKSFEGNTSLPRPATPVFDNNPTPPPPPPVVAQEVVKIPGPPRVPSEFTSTTRAHFPRVDFPK